MRIGDRRLRGYGNPKIEPESLIKRGKKLGASWDRRGFEETRRPRWGSVVKKVEKRLVVWRGRGSLDGTDVKERDNVSNRICITFFIHWYMFFFFFAEALMYVKINRKLMIKFMNGQLFLFVNLVASTPFFLESQQKKVSFAIAWAWFAYINKAWSFIGSPLKRTSYIYFNTCSN